MTTEEECVELVYAMDTKNWDKIGKRQCRRRKLPRAGIAALRKLGIVTLRRQSICHGGKRSNLAKPAMWFGLGGRLCSLENRPNTYRYKLKERHAKKGVALLDLREEGGQAGYAKMEACFNILANGCDDAEFDYSRDSLVPLMLFRALEDEGIHGWVANDDEDLVECLLLKPHALLQEQYGGLSHTRMPAKKRHLHDGGI